MRQKKESTAWMICFTFVHFLRRTRYSANQDEIKRVALYASFKSDQAKAQTVLAMSHHIVGRFEVMLISLD